MSKDKSYARFWKYANGAGEGKRTLVTISLRLCAHFGTPALNLLFDSVPYTSSFLENLIRCSIKARGITKTPMQSRRNTWKNWTPFCAGFIANSDHVGKSLSRFEHVEHRLGLFPGNIDANLSHNLDNHRIEFAWFESCAVGLKIISTYLTQKRLCHLAPRAIVDANE